MKTIYTLIGILFSVQGFCQAPEIEWQNTIGGTNDDWLYSISESPIGGYYLGGISHSGISGDKTQANFAYTDCWVLKLFPTGLIEWQKTLGGNSDDILYDIQATLDGGCIIIAASKSGVSGNKSEANIGSNDFWIIKLNSTGVIEW